MYLIVRSALPDIISDDDDAFRDTVASVGVITGRSLPFTNTNSSVKTFRHALSLDEVRYLFLVFRLVDFVLISILCI